MIEVPFFDLKEQHAGLLPELQAAAERVLRDGRFCLGPEVEAFEQAIAQLHDCPFAVGVNSGTSALHLALLAAGVGPGDEVITSPFTFVATAAAIRYCGASPVYADILETTATLDPASVARAITPRTRAILAVHLYGQFCRMEELAQLAAEHKLVLLEDGAQAHLARRHQKTLGHWTQSATLSFYPSKNLGACGESGAILTRNEAIASRLRLLRDWGQREKYRHQEQAFNYRMDSLQAAFLQVKLGWLPEWTRLRREKAASYDRQLASLPLRLPRVDAGNHHVYHLYPIRIENRDRVRQHLQARGIDTGCHYPLPVHLQPGYLDPRFPEGSLPLAEGFARSVVTLPLYPELPETHQSRVCHQLRQTLEELPA